MAEYIEREKLPQKKERGFFLDDYFNAGWNACLDNIASIPAADVLPRDEAITMGAELAAMHGSDATSQQLEEAYLKGVEDGMTRRDVRPVVRGHIEEDENTYLFCSECNCNITLAAYETPDNRLVLRPNFCPNCGADMKEES